MNQLRIILMSAGFVAMLLMGFHGAARAQQANIELLNERGLENRSRIQALEAGAGIVLQKLTRIETEMEMMRKSAEETSTRIWAVIIAVATLILEKLALLAQNLKSKD